MNITVNAKSLLSWARFGEEAPKVTKRNLAKALNDFGSGIARATAMTVSRDTGLPIDQVSRMLEIRHATSNNLFWEMDASRVIDDQSQRKFPKREWKSGEDQQFKQALVKILTREDELVCEKCQEVSEHGPYTLEEAQKILPVHPNCRCFIDSYAPKRRAPLTFSTRFGPAPRSRTVEMTPAQLATKISEAADAAIRLVAKLR